MVRRKGSIVTTFRGTQQLVHYFVMPDDTFVWTFNLPNNFIEGLNVTIDEYSAVLAECKEDDKERNHG